MREILFRGKRTDNGEWVDGYLSAYDLICQNYPEDTSNATGDYYGQTPYVGFVEVDPETVGQFTGMTDKNGKRIFEGDIVRCGSGRICKVIFFISPGFSGFDLVPIGGFDAPPPHNWSLFSDTEVIGNITDNPELLEK